MISTNDQNDLFNLISRSLKSDVKAYAFGGTAMMYYGYKNATKDIDLVFDSEKDYDEFVNAIKILGYKKKSIKGIYPDKKQLAKGKPEMYTRGEERFDLFLNKIFGTILTDDIKGRLFSRHDFAMGNSVLMVNVLSKEDLIILKSVTERENDFQDILTIIEKERTIDWDFITDEAVKQSRLGDGWILLDMEKTLKRLKEHTLIKEKYFDKIYNG